MRFLQQTDRCPYCDIEIRHHNPEQYADCIDSLEHDDKSKVITDTLKSSRMVSQQFGIETFGNSNIEFIGDNATSWEEADWWLESDAVGLYLWGPSGTGKSYAARSILYQAMEARFSVYESSAYKIFSAMSRFDRDRFVDLEYIRILLIDDIDKMDWDSKAVSALWSLLNERTNNQCRTIITSNVARYKLRSVFVSGAGGNGSKIESMMQRLHPITKLEFKGESLRGRE